MKLIGYLVWILSNIIWIFHCFIKYNNWRKKTGIKILQQFEVKVNEEINESFSDNNIRDRDSLRSIFPGWYDQTGSRIIYDANYDYYENLIGRNSTFSSHTMNQGVTPLSFDWICFFFEAMGAHHQHNSLQILHTRSQTESYHHHQDPTSSSWSLSPWSLCCVSQCYSNQECSATTCIPASTDQDSQGSWTKQFVSTIDRHGRQLHWWHIG